MPEIYVDIAEKIAQVRGKPTIVCGNSDYTVHFTFDAEWDAYEAKIARFWRIEDGNRVYTDVLFSGDTAAVPVLHGTLETAVGVYAGDIHTTAPARIPCSPCITDGDPIHADPGPDVYTQIKQYLLWLASGSGCVSSAGTAGDAVSLSTVCIASNWEVT